MSFQSKIWKGVLIASFSFFGAKSFAQTQPLPSFSVVKSGPTSSMTLGASIKVADGDRGKDGSFYVAANVPNRGWIVLSDGKWSAWDGVSVPNAYSTTPEKLDDKTIVVATNQPMLGFVGSQVYVGYGLNYADMRDNKKFASYTIPQDPNLHLKKVSETDAGIQYNASASHIYRTCDNNQCADDDKLFVFFPGSDGSALDTQRIADAIGSTGIRVLVLEYENHVSTNDICGTDDACYANVRQARMEGSDSGNPVIVQGADSVNYVIVSSTADGIKNRLLRALMALNWTQFYEGDQILFNKIIFGGFSQGAGMAAWVGKHYPVARVCQFSGTWDGWQPGGTGHPSTWLYASSADKTPPGSFYGFSHQNDSINQDGKHGIDYLNINWMALGMGNNPPSLYDVDGLNGQKIYTTNAECSSGHEHECSVQDAYTPLNTDGTAKFAGVWRYVCGR